MGDFQLDQRAIATVTDGATGMLAAAPKYLTSAVSNVVNVVSYFVMVPFIAFFLIRDGRAFKSHLIELVPNRYFEMSLSILSKIEDQVGRYLRGILLEASAIGIMSSIGLLIIGAEVGHRRRTGRRRCQPDPLPRTAGRRNGRPSSSPSAPAPAC